MRGNSPVLAFIALGANLGDREATMRAAANEIAATPGIFDFRLSPLLEFAAVGGPPNSPPFLNAAAELRTDLSPQLLLARLLEIEAQFGRQRHEKWGPRTIDLDLLLYGDLIIDEPGLTVPHPRMQERRFVLEPLAALTPQVRHPVSGLTIAQLLAEI
jgi:2-amino-4-hydroxy-6-hydroxymethyldihydropteridine diphosphokinase